MMQIQNEKYTLTFILEGAQLVSLVDNKTKTEFVHDGKKGWAQHNPTLFPIVCNMKDNQTIIDGQSYAIPKHGILRRAPFELMNQSDTAISFIYRSNEETKKVYPFDFEFIKTYELVDNEVIISHRIVNTGNGKMLCSIGHHPAFKCPIEEGETMEDYHIEFDEEENIETMLINLENGLFIRDAYDFKDTYSKTVALPFDIEKYNTLVYHNLKSPYVHLVGPKHKISVSAVSFPFFGIWHVKEENFVCLEPWLTHSDYEDFDGLFEHKDGIIEIEAKKSYLNTYSIRIDG